MGCGELFIFGVLMVFSIGGLFILFILHDII